MRRSIPLRVAALSLMAVCGVTAIVWSRAKAHAAIAPAATVAAAVTQFGGAGGGESNDNPPEVPKIYVRLPYSPEAISAYEKLQRKIDMPFAQETPLNDVIKYLVDQLNPTDDEGKPLSNEPPLQFYINPQGLQDSEKSNDSPVAIDLKQIPASTGLELVLEQLGLEYHVRPDGIVEIDAVGSDRADRQDPMLLLLNEIRQLRTEVAEMKMHRGGKMGVAWEAWAAG